MIVYLPSNELMFKMMRACFGCQSKDDLWINFNSNQGACESENLSSVQEEQKE